MMFISCIILNYFVLSLHAVTFELVAENQICDFASTYRFSDVHNTADCATAVDSKPECSEIFMASQSTGCQCVLLGEMCDPEEDPGEIYMVKQTDDFHLLQFAYSCENEGADVKMLGTDLSIQECYDQTQQNGAACGDFFMASSGGPCRCLAPGAVCDLDDSDDDSSLFGIGNAVLGGEEEEEQEEGEEGGGHSSAYASAVIVGDPSTHGLIIAYNFQGTGDASVDVTHQLLYWTITAKSVESLQLSAVKTSMAPCAGHIPLVVPTGKQNILCDLYDGEYRLWVITDTEADDSAQWLIKGTKIESEDEVPFDGTVCTETSPDPLSACDVNGLRCWYDYRCCDNTLYFCSYSSVAVCTNSGWMSADIQMTCPVLTNGLDDNTYLEDLSLTELSLTSSQSDSSSPTVSSQKTGGKNTLGGFSLRLGVLLPLVAVLILTNGVTCFLYSRSPRESSSYNDLMEDVMLSAYENAEETSDHGQPSCGSCGFVL